MRFKWRSAIGLLLLVIILSAVGLSCIPKDFSVYSTDTAALNSKLYTLSLGEENFSASAGNTKTAYSSGQYTAKLKILGFLPIKTVTVDIIENQEVSLGGKPFGIKLYTDGVMVVGTGNFLYQGQSVNPANEAGIRTGDRLMDANGIPLESNEQLTKIVEETQGNPIRFTVIRKNLKFEATVTPILPDADQNYRLGIWVRDSSAGLGTLTYFNHTTGNVAGLGHSVADIDTGEIMPSASGSLVAAEVTGIEKGEKGSAGELSGTFLDTKYGALIANTECGVFAKAEKDVFDNAETIPIALKGEITTGKASIYASVSGDHPDFYDIEIVKINNNLKQNKNMVIRVTDERLLGTTGGIVQGMSGSPIVQNGKLIGAVTHVFINDPTEGYGIFIEKMLLEENSLSITKNES